MRQVVKVTLERVASLPRAPAYLALPVTNWDAPLVVHEQLVGQLTGHLAIDLRGRWPFRRVTIAQA